MIKSEELNKKIDLFFPNGSLNENNEPNYSQGASIWAAFDVKAPGGRAIQIDNMEATVQTRWIKIRYLVGIQTDWRIRYGTQMFEINQPPIDLNMSHREIYLELKLVKP